MVLINNINHAYHFPQTLRPIVYALQNFDRNFANLVDQQTDLRTILSVAKYIFPLIRHREQRSNRCIIGDAILPKTGKKIDQKNAVRNLAVCRRAI